MRLRKLALPSVLVLAIAPAAGLGLAGCSDEGGASSPLDEALGFLPADAGFVFVASTDSDDYKPVENLLKKFPFGDRAKESLEDGLEKGDVDFEQDVKPLLGNEIVVGAVDTRAFAGDSNSIVAAIETKDGGKLEKVIEKGGKKSGEAEGYDIYAGNDTYVAVKDEVAVLSGDEDTLKDALKQRDSDDRLREEDVEDALDELPEGTPIRIYANVERLLASSPQAKQALKVKWVDQLETLGLGVSVEDDRVAVDYVLRTNPDGLTDADLPLASGDDAPQLLEREQGAASVEFALRDPAHIFDFALRAGKAVDPARFGEFDSAKKQIGERLGIDIDKDVIAQLEGEVAASATVGGDFAVRAELADPAAFEQTLAKVADGLPKLVAGASRAPTITKPQRDGGLYTISQRGGPSYSFGVVDDLLVVANTPRLAEQVAARKTVDAEDQQGAFVAAADAEQLANALLSQFRGPLEAIGGSLFTGPLGDLKLSLSADTEGLRGRFELEIE